MGDVVPEKRLRLKNIMGNIPGINFQLKMESTGQLSIPYVCDGIRELLHVSPQQLYQNPQLVTSQIHPDDFERLKADLYQSAQNMQTWTYQFRLELEQMGTRWHFGQACPVQQPDKSILWHGFIIDATADILFKSQYLDFHSAVNNASIVATTDKKGDITSVNDNFCAISGYTRDELMGQNHRILNSGFHDKNFFREMWQTISQRQVWRGEVKNKKKDGDFYWVNTIISPLLDPSGNSIEGYISVRFDITADKERQMRLIENSKLSSLGEMSAGIAHEINNPLGIISGKVERLHKHLKRDELDREAMLGELSKIESMIERIGRIVSSLKSYSRNADQDPAEEVRLSEIIESTMEICRERLERNGVKILISISENATIECRASQISQVLVNLITNAYDAIEQLPEKWIQIKCKKLAQSVKIEVSDCGLGIKPEIADKIMTPFYTTKEVGRGTGLGLSISQRIISEHHGTFFYDPTAANTTFVITLPLKQARDSS
jgi:PAS domain S-box-containing protein